MTPTHEFDDGNDYPGGAERAASNIKESHKLRREHTGEGIEGGITPTCSCGWRGRTEYAHNDWQHTNVLEQENLHLFTFRGP